MWRTLTRDFGYLDKIYTSVRKLVALQNPLHASERVKPGTLLKTRQVQMGWHIVEKGTNYPFKLGSLNQFEPY